jgi:hypothetical protein
MAQGILIVAESGSGKSTSIENLNPKETFIINLSGKPLPFKGWKSKYNVWNKDSNPNGNMIIASDQKTIEACMRYISEKRPEIKNLIIDDFQYLSSFEFFDRSDEKGFEKFTQIGATLARISRLPIKLREDLMVFFLTHVEEGTDIEGRKRYKAKTIGKLIDDKLTLEGLFSIVLFGKAKKDKEGNIKYIFETQNSGDNTCKSPKDMFTTSEIPNDLSLVREAILNYEN